MNEKLAAVQRGADKILDWFAVVLFMIVFIVVLLQVFMRFVFNAPIVWSEELSRYVFMWVCFIGWCIATRNGTHIRIAFVVDLLPKPARKALDVVNYILSIIFAAILLCYGTFMMKMNVHVATVTLFFTYAFVYAAVPFTMVFLIFYNVLRLITGKPITGGTLA